LILFVFFFFLFDSFFSLFILLFILLIFLYTNRTFPTLNILIYNIFGSSSGLSGDELYGVEPAGYYIKNLILNTGIIQIFWICFIILFLLKLLSFNIILNNNNNNKQNNNNIEKTDVEMKIDLLSVITQKMKYYETKTSVIWFSVFLWLSVLFSRPHKVSCCDLY
jgi:ABC-type transport system involved in multi-copper enzyme maturation permease subunit